MNRDLEIYKPVAEAVSLLLFPHAEVIIHDIESDRIFAIFNNFSKRSIGDESLLEEMEAFSQMQDLFPPYFKTNWDGRRMRSVTAVLKSHAGEAIGLLCINLDISKWEEMHRLVLDMIQPATEMPEFLFKQDWREQINLFVTHYLREQGLHINALKRKEKLQLLSALQAEGAFETKNAASYVADVLQISRATVYNYLKEIHENPFL